MQGDTQLGAKDTVTKEYMQDAEIFADAFNYLIFDGEQVVKAERLHEMDTTSIVIPFGDDAKPELVQKYRDVLKMMTAMQDENAAYVIFGVENQSELNYCMPVRNGLYDMIQYSRQVEEAARLHREAKNHGESTAEFLSGFHKTDKLIPVITLVVFWNPDEWTAPRTLYEMMNVKDKRYLAYVPDYKINLISPAEIEDFGKFHTELSTAMKFLKYSSDKKKLKKVLSEDKSFESVTRKTADLLNIVTGANLKIEGNSEGGVNMCKAIEEIKNDAVAEKDFENIKRMLGMGKFTNEEISAALNVSIKLVEEIANGKAS